MRITRLYVDKPLAEDNECILTNDRFHYLINVLRLEPGRPLVLFNGQGGEYKATLVEANKKQARVKVEAFVDVDRESTLFTELAIGLSRGDRMDWVVQKATELGVSKITPLLTERTEVKLSRDRAEKKRTHWQQIIINACEQCRRNRLPEIAEIRTFADWVERVAADCRLVLDVTEKSHSLFKQPVPNSVAILVGPEGGFSQAEVMLAGLKGFVVWSLGPRVLRTETAPVAALAIVQQIWGDFAG